MIPQLRLSIALITLSLFLGLASGASWEPPGTVSREAILRAGIEVGQMPDIPFATQEDVFRIRTLGLDWDVGVTVYQPNDSSRIPSSSEGSKFGIFLLHGGTSDWRSLDGTARLLAGKFGYRVVSMTFPGRLYLEDPSRDWPGDTVNADGSFRTPIWLRGEKITPDQYQVIRDTDSSGSDFGGNYGVTYFLRAQEGSLFYHRMAAWPVAFEEGMLEAFRRHFPEESYKVFVHGHSTGGPFVHYLSQRVANIQGIVGYGTALFGYMNAEAGNRWDYPFNHLRLRTWRDTARYMDEGFAGKDIPLPVKIEMVLENWDQAKKRAHFKAEDFVHKNSVSALETAARAVARRLALGEEKTQALVQRYLGYLREQSGPGVKPVPAILHISGVGDTTVTHDRHVQYGIPIYAAMQPAPKVRAVLFGAGTHSWGYKGPDLPDGIAPAVTKFWDQAIRNGYFD